MAEENRKLSYEELEKVATQMAQQNEMFREQLKQMQLNEVVARLQFLFKVVELAKHFDKEYVSKCVADIQKILVFEEPESNNNEEISTESK